MTYTRRRRPNPNTYIPGRTTTTTNSNNNRRSRLISPDITNNIHVRFARESDLDALLNLSLPANLSLPIWNYIFPNLSRDRRLHPEYNTFRNLLKQHISCCIHDCCSLYLVAESQPAAGTLLAAVCLEWLSDHPLQDRKLKVIPFTFHKRIVNAGEGKDQWYQFSTPPDWETHQPPHPREEETPFEHTISGFFSDPNNYDDTAAAAVNRRETATRLGQLSEGLATLQDRILLSTAVCRAPIDPGSGVWVNTPFSLCFGQDSGVEERQAALGEMLNWMSDVVSLGAKPRHELGGPDGIALVFPLSQPRDWIENGTTDRFLGWHNFARVRRPVADVVVEVEEEMVVEIKREFESDDRGEEGDRNGGRKLLEQYELWFREARLEPRRRGEWVRYKPEETYRLMRTTEARNRRRREEEARRREWKRKREEEARRRRRREEAMRRRRRTEDSWVESYIV
ncbi:hypothetical protein QBC41DRAFT_300573 [Cercophora samala]|uniref:Uncharacterized protein n=1 Tax=Cercophora samala TaxID=330535 RepID=A0AA40DCA2_9PEZI|nr:hypothetical protein QBC41DRAFT_300573 [Cercophora samala]